MSRHKRARISRVRLLVWRFSTILTPSINKTLLDTINHSPRQLQRTIHRVHEVLPEAREERRAVVLGPQPARLALHDDLLYPACALGEVVRRGEVLVPVPVAVWAPTAGLASSAGRAGYREKG